MLIAYLSGLVLALAISAYAMLIGLDITAVGFLAWTLHRSPFLSWPRDRAGS